MLGYGEGLAQSSHYSPATAAAVQRWQKARGLQATGEILLGEVVFEPGPIRVTSVTPTVGSPVGGAAGGGAGGGGAGGGGTVLAATGTTPVVTVSLDVTQEYLVKPGEAVSVTLPDGTSTVRGHVQSVGAMATCPGRRHGHRQRQQQQQQRVGRPVTVLVGRQQRRRGQQLLPGRHGHHLAGLGAAGGGAGSGAGECEHHLAAGR